MKKFELDFKRMFGMPKIKDDDEQIRARLDKYDEVAEYDFQQDTENAKLEYRARSVDSDSKWVHRYFADIEKGKCGEIFAFSGKKGNGGFTYDVAQKTIYEKQEANQTEDGHKINEADKAKIIKSLNRACVSAEKYNEIYNAREI